MSRVKELVSDEELMKAFAGTHYGNKDYRDIIKLGLLKSACKYHSGYTTSQILKRLELIKENLKLTKKGRQYLYDSIQYSSINTVVEKK
tara:strand:- start:137 stop:403 length:267 start_codon:yes stop_codon:yes gene_type:complete